MKLYYLIWVDCIVKARSKEGNEKTWPFLTMTMMSLPMVVDMMLFMTIFERDILGRSFYNLNVSGFSEYTNKVFSFVILFALPCVIINYVLIFRKNRYEKLIKKYTYYQGNLFLAFFLISMLAPIILIVLGIFLS